MRTFAILPVLVVLTVSTGCAHPETTGGEPTDHATTEEQMPEQEPASYAETLERIALDIERLRADYPQLGKFRATSALEPERLTISYGYRTHQPQRRAGWAGGVPNPDPDGLWFHIDFHDPDSTAQIHTQPVVEPLHFRDKRVMFLILEGEETKPVAGALREVLMRHGVTAGSPGD